MARNRIDVPWIWESNCRVCIDSTRPAEAMLEWLLAVVGDREPVLGKRELPASSHTHTGGQGIFARQSWRKEKHVKASSLANPTRRGWDGYKGEAPTAAGQDTTRHDKTGWETVNRTDGRASAAEGVSSRRSYRAGGINVNT